MLKGNFTFLPRLIDIKLAESGFIKISDCLFGQRHMYLSLCDTFVDSYKSLLYQVPIKRIGEGVTQKDFEVDFTGPSKAAQLLKNTEEEIFGEQFGKEKPSSIFKENLDSNSFKRITKQEEDSLLRKIKKQRDLYIIFDIPKPSHQTLKKLEHLSIPELEDLRTQAEVANNFEQAAKIRDLINWKKLEEK